MNIAVDIIKKIAPNAKESIINEMVNTFNANYQKYGINTPDRLAAFIAQCAHETGGFQYLVESGWLKNYDKINKANHPNYYPYYGRGIIQTTWEDGYRDTSIHLFGDTRLLKNPDILLQPKYATLSAMHFWQKNGLNELADKGSFKTITKKINGGLNGYSDRKSYWEKAKSFLKKKI